MYPVTLFNHGETRDRNPPVTRANARRPGLPGIPHPPPTHFSTPGLIGNSMTHHEAFEHHDHPEPSGESKTCRVCSHPYSHTLNPSRFGICERCGYKILIVLLIVMISLSYVAWFGVF